MYRSINVNSLRESLVALLDAGESAAAIEILASSWPAISTTDGALIRALLARIPEAEWGSDAGMIAAMGASFRSLDSTDGLAAIPWFLTAEALLAANDATSPIAASVLVHHSAALRSVGRIDSAVQKADAAWQLLATDVSLTASVRVRVQAEAALQVGLARLHLGDTDAATAMLRIALSVSDDTLIQSELVECLSGLAILTCLSGDLDAATLDVASAIDAAGQSGLLQSRFGAGALVAEALVAVERNETPDLPFGGPLPADVPGDSDWTPYLHLARASVQASESRSIEALDQVRQGLVSVRGWEAEPLVRTMLLELRGSLLLRLGEFSAAVASLQAIEPSADHTICPTRFLAGIRFKAGDSMGCLVALHECELIESHAPRSFIDVLLLKSAASHLLDDHRGSDVAMDRALLLAAKRGIRAPFLWLPAHLVQRLLTRAADRQQPEIVQQLLRVLRVVHHAPVTASLDPLSERERIVARHLFDDKTIRQIASDLYISTNTVKSHVRSIYRKLAANNRRDAVRRVRELGVDLTATRP